jgi:phosphatidate cytidylyltransferase
VGDRESWELFDDASDDVFGKRSDSGQVVPPVQDGPATMPLPHWTEPPSGEVPRILPDSDPPAGADEELSAWSALSTSPRWRDQPADWDEADFHDTVLDDRESRLGALRDEPDAPEGADIFAFDEPPVAAKAPSQGRARGTATQTRPLPRPARQPAPPREPPMGAPPGAPPAGGGQGDVTTRVITGLIAAGVCLAAASIGPGALVVVVLAAVTMASAELFQALRSRGYQPATLLGLVASGSMVAGVYWRGEEAFALILSLMVVFSFLWYLTGVVRARPTMNIAVSVMAFVYVGFLGSFAALLLKVPNDNGIGLLLGAVIATVAFDVGSFFVGRASGKTPLAPALSPNKTFEGLVGGVVASVLVSLLLVGRIHPWDTGKAFWLGVVVAVAAPLGDLCESMIKRDLGLKDMGKLLPGHGGVLDRIDALLFVIPATYYLARVVF